MLHSAKPLPSAKGSLPSVKTLGKAAASSSAYGRPFSLIEGFAVHMGASKQAVADGEGNELPPLANDRAQEHLV